jgi:deazaflavin-dependent oxidoreductase (nitroreductase family)
VLARLASTRLMSAVSRTILPPLDSFVLRRSQGSSTATGWLTGLPALWLTTTGARSGLRRTVPLLGIPHGDTLALLGTRFGHRDTPAWVYNLVANPTVEVRYESRVVPARARPAQPEEEATIWATASRIYPGYAFYSDRASHRKIGVFVLEPF